MSTQTPSQLVGGRYRLVEPLGRGGMGTVWSAVDETLGRQVAVKEVTPPPELDDTQRSQLRERTLREARAAARIDSPAAVTVYDVVEEDGRPWIVMQLLPARTLADVIREDGPLTDRAVAAVGLRVLEALEAAHRAGVLHRDVKPANVLMPAGGGAVLSDFGIASLEGDASMTTTGMLVGSPAYMAPERARGVPPSSASDLWSLGATLSTALRGRSPFERDGQIPTLMAVLHDDPDRAPGTGPLAEAIDGLLRKDPGQRLTAAQVRPLLNQAAAAATESAAAPPLPTIGVVDRTQPVPVIPDTPLAPFRAPEGSVRPAPPRPPTLPPATLPTRQASRPAPSSEVATTYGREPRRGVAAALAALLLLAGAVAAFALWPRSPGAHLADPAASPAATSPKASRNSAPASAATSPTPPPTTSAGQSPSATTSPSSLSPSSGTPKPAPPAGGVGTAAGFTSYNNGAYRVDVPNGWVADVRNQQTYFHQPNGRSFLLVERGGVPDGDPLKDWQNQEPTTARTLNGYQRIRIVRVLGYKTFSAADWEFTWLPSGGQLHVLDRNIVSGNHAYAVYWSVPEAQWASSQPALQHVLDSFTPTE